jgi:hypothetical protein
MSLCSAFGDIPRYSAAWRAGEAEGGNAPFIGFDDADLGHAVAGKCPYRPWAARGLDRFSVAFPPGMEAQPAFARSNPRQPCGAE